MKYIPYLLSLLFFSVLTWLFVGIRQDDEFGELDLFLKYRPSTRVYFHSPRGMGDETPTGQEDAQYDYDDFILTAHSTDGYDILAYVWVQLSLTALSAFVVMWLFKREAAWTWQLLHAVLLFIPTAFALVFLLIFDHRGLYVLGTVALLAVNVGAMWLLRYRRKVYQA